MTGMLRKGPALCPQGQLFIICRWSCLSESKLQVMGGGGGVAVGGESDFLQSPLRACAAWGRGDLQQRACAIDWNKTTFLPEQ